MTQLLLIVIALLLVVACGAFVAAEFAFVTVDRASVERAAQKGDGKARGVLAALRTLSTQLSGAQVGITMTNLLIGFLAEPSIASVVDGPLESVGLSGAAADAIALAIAIVLATGVTMVFGELVPKNLALARPLETARAVQGFQRGFTRAMGIVIRLFNGSANAILRRLGVEPQEELASARTAEELASLVRRSEQQGTLAAETATLLTRSLTFGDRRAADVITPRRRVHTVRADAPVLSVLEQGRATGRSRFPVVEAGAEDVVGAVHIKHAMAVPPQRREAVAVREVMVAPVLAPASVELDVLLETLRRGGLQMAVVVDEWGNVDGIATLEDLIEEIVGEVRDEYDPREDPARPLGERSWSLSGLVRRDEVARLVGIVLPADEEYETLAGLIALELARVPRVGDVVELGAVDTEGARRHVALTVLSMDGLRVDRVRLDHIPVPPAEGEDREDQR